MTTAVARCRNCGGEQDLNIVVVVDLGETNKTLGAVVRRLGNIEHELRSDMSEIDDKLTGVEGAEAAEAAVLTTLSADETRELADLTELKNQPEGPELTPEQEARFDALTAKIAADTAAAQADDDAINSADPAPVVTPPADGSTDAPTEV